MEDGRGVAEKKGPDDVVLQISTNQEPFLTTQENRDSKFYTLSKSSQLGSSPRNSDLELSALGNPRLRIQTSTFATSPSSEIAKQSPTPTPTRPPKIPATQSITRRKSFSRSEFSKPKSRFVEPFYPNDAQLKEEKNHLANSSSPYNKSPNRVSASTPKDHLKSAPITPRTPLIASPGPEEEEEEDEEVYKNASLKVTRKMGKKWKVLILFEFTIFVCFGGLLIASLTVDKLKNSTIWSLQLWKWCVLILVIFCGRLVTEWLLNILVFLIERNFLLKKKVLYFVYGLKKSVQAVIWLGLVLLAWGLLFNRGVKRSRHTSKVLNYITKALASFLIGAAIWLLKTLFVKLLASSFHVTRFFDRIQESIFHQYILITLSGPPVMEMAERIGSSKSTPGHLTFNSFKKQNEDKKEEVIDVDKLKRMKHEKVSAWTMKGLVSVVTGTGLSTLSNTLDESDEEEGEQSEITSEWEAKAAAYKIFKNVAKPGSKYIDEEDLLRFMKKEEVDNVIPLFEGATETRKIKRSTLKNWLVNVYNERKALAHSLNDTKTAIEELNRLGSGVVVVVVIIVWLLIMGFLTTKVLVFISSQFLLVAFMFGNTAKTVFEAMIFVFVMHPFDVGDRCVIDGVQMVVEEMNILTTIFLRYDNEKIFYPNSILATKPISNFYRSPEMSDAVEFAVDVSTSIETIGLLKAKIKAYLESKPQHWRPGHSVQVKEIEDVNKMKMALYVNHTINFQNAADRGNRRSDLVLEMKKYFEELGIRYHLLPQEVRLSYVNSPIPPLAR
ncbi:mechanosensitive ion channel protein 10 [Ricinus communis]|uniref:mechanosensitive ion channel protein 10 n=1 Tax=Ricinus communis TaxID=3988 RepID=UPI00201B0291|nr:mechanosensitive ion channel protein 10 [Ricinus communis]XP_015571685.2 mechanosensitive ion channel protein 10 [Ricinus communis]XP_015571686.2 mechanosensitive ion channel protein 10 [Ricinus communis]